MLVMPFVDAKLLPWDPYQDHSIDPSTGKDHFDPELHKRIIEFLPLTYFKLFLSLLTVEVVIPVVTLLLIALIFLLMTPCAPCILHCCWDRVQYAIHYVNEHPLFRTFI